MFNFNFDPSFGPIGEVFIAEFRSEVPDVTGGKLAPNVGHCISRANLETGAIYKTGLAAFTTEGGSLTFEKENEMYNTDFGIYKPLESNVRIFPNTYKSILIFRHIG
ncbi:hypothetical protein [Bacillus cereus group sp. BfR-BA-01380]|uniref:hypothetical protein n=1 Tax=Bacillus cereus group sp. BfR-BA-01380 TaxID=2920324 RepID=UPI001F59A8CC|nr:hypothetical protein [Bacillus cereus group sp. BfR-BA-01380]